MSNLLLTSSMDWTIKLWNPEVRKSPLFSFESGQQSWVYDVQWSPKHPAVFASVDNAGYLDIWNINQSKEAPVVKGLPHQKADNMHEAKARPINCLRWDAEGRRIITGDADGYITLMQVHQDLSNPTEEDFNQIV